MKLRAIICDDEQKYIDEISSYLQKYCFEHDIACESDCFVSGKEALKSDTFYNIAFLDVELGEVTGLDIAKRLKDRNKNVIIFFITAYKKYIDDAMNLFALRFLEKPFDYMRFYSGLDKAIELINQDVVEFYLKDSGKIKRVNANDIMYVETMNHKTKVVLQDKVYYSATLLDEWEKKLTHNSFYRVHKSYMLNLDYVSEYKRDQVTLANENIVPISYRNQSDFRKYFNGYLKRRK